VSLTVVVPVYNEEKSIGSVLSAVIDLPFVEKVIVVNDGSTDRTGVILAPFENLRKVEVIHFPVNRGKGAAIKEALKRVDTEYVAFQDADLEYPPENLRRLYSAARLLGADMVIGVRTMSWDEITGISLGSFIANKLIVRLTGCPDVFSGQRIVKMEFLRKVGLESSGFEIETELTMKAILLGYDVAWERVSYFPRSRSEGKKIGFLDFLKIMRTYYKLRFSRQYAEAQA